jgi:hypothetical protein
MALAASHGLASSMRRLRDIALPTPRTAENGLSVRCNACLRKDYADLPGLIAVGYGDVPLHRATVHMLWVRQQRYLYGDGSAT